MFKILVVLFIVVVITLVIKTAFEMGRREQKRLSRERDQFDDGDSKEDEDIQ